MPAYNKLLERITALLHTHKTRHQDGGADEISVADLSGLLADDQHVLDNEVTAVAVAKSIFTTKGDIVVASGSATPVRVGVGANDTQLTADSNEASGVKWAEVSVISLDASKVTDTNNTLLSIDLGGV